LAEKYIADLQKKQKAIGDKDFKTQEEIRALKNGSNIQMNTHTDCTEYYKFIRHMHTIIISSICSMGSLS